MNEAAKRSALRMIPYSVHIVGLTDGGKSTGYTGSWLSQCSFEPPMIAICVKKHSSGHRMIESSRVFSINLLGNNRQSTAELFFSPPVEKDDHLGSVQFHKGSTGAPILDLAIAYLECTTEQIVDTGGDHVIVVGKIVDSGLRSEEPALTQADGGWHYGG